jgi:ADP-ribose pyrophosphatase YjhB (NUDIX family)
LDQLRASRPELIVEHLGELRTALEGSDFAWPPNAAAFSRVVLPVVTVGALICDQDGQVLMVRTRKWSNLWGIPGGKVKYGETCESALRREILEETSLELEHIEFVLAQDCIESEEFYRPAHFVLLNYLARCSGRREVVLNDEAQEYRWLSVDAALGLELNRPTRVLLEAARERTAHS